MISAGNFVGKPPPNGIYEWSPSLEKTGRTVKYWKVQLYQKEGGDDHTGMLTRLRHQLAIDDNRREDKEYIKSQLAIACKELRNKIFRNLGNTAQT